MMKRALGIFLSAVLLFAQGSVYAAEVLTLDPLIEEALRNNPDLLAARKRWDAAVARVPRSKAWEDPSIGVTFEKIPRGTVKLNKTMPDDRMLTFSQFFPLFGKLSLKGKIAVVEAQMFAAEYKGKELEIVNRVKNAYYDLFMSSKEIELTRESLALLESIAKVAEANYGVGKGTQEEVYKIHLEIARLTTDLVNLELGNKVKQTRVNTLLNRDPEGVLGIPDLGEKAVFKEDITALYQFTLLNQPELIILSYAIEKNKFAKSLAQKGFFPDLMAGIVQRGITSGTIGPWDLMLSFTVPLWFWTKQRYEVKEAIANVEEAEAAYTAMQNGVYAEVKELFTGVEIAKNKMNVLETSLIPMLESSIESSLAGYRSGKGDFMMLLDSQRMLVDTRMDYYKALVEYHTFGADLERAAGLRVNEGQAHRGET